MGREVTNKGNSNLSIISKILSYGSQKVQIYIIQLENKQQIHELGKMKHLPRTISKCERKKHICKDLSSSPFPGLK